METSDTSSSSSGRLSAKPLSSPHRQRKQPPNAIPDKDLRFKIVVRVYGAHGDFTYGHSYIVDDVPLGISSPVAEYYLGAFLPPSSFVSPPLSSLRFTLTFMLCYSSHLLMFLAPFIRIVSFQMLQSIHSKSCVICFAIIQPMPVTWRSGLWCFKKVEAHLPIYLSL